MMEQADASQAELLASLHARAFPKPWSAAEIAKLMENPSVFAILSRDPEPQGFVIAWAIAADSEILTLAVTPDARRKGIGSALVTAASVAALVRGAATMHLEVGETNAAALALYKKLGFEQAGRRSAYYAGEGGAVDALVMRRNLPRPAV